MATPGLTRGTLAGLWFAESPGWLSPEVTDSKWALHCRFEAICVCLDNWVTLLYTCGTCKAGVGVNGFVFLVVHDAISSP